MRTLACMGILAVALITPLASQSANPNSFTSVGCINRAVHSGSVGGNAGVPPATPNTAAVLANTADPTNVFHLNGATPPDAAEDILAKAETGAELKEPTSYVLDGTIAEFEKHVGKRVKITGTLLPASEPGQEAATKSNVRHIRVASIQDLASACESGPKKPSGQ